MQVNLSAITSRSVEAAPRPNGSYKHGNIYRSEYVRVAKNIIGFIKGKGTAPNYASTSLGRIPFSQLVYMYSKILAFYGAKGILPICYNLTSLPSTPFYILQGKDRLSELQGIKDS